MRPWRTLKRAAGRLPPQWHLVRAWAWWVAVPVFIWRGWHESVFVIFLWSTYANFASDLTAYEGACTKHKQEQQARKDSQ